MAALAVCDVEQPVFAPDIVDLQRHDLGDAQGAAVGDKGGGAVAQVVDAVDQATDVGLRDGPRKPVGNPPAVKILDLLRLIHGVDVEQTQGRDVGIGRARTAPRVDPARHPDADLLG